MTPRNALPVLPTTVVGSFPQPEWLVYRDALLSGGVPRVPRPTLWRVPEEIRDQAHDDATRLVVRDLERAGVDIVSDGEVRRESYFSWLAPALTGLDVAKPGTATSRTGRPTPVPRAVGPITRPKPVLARHTAFLRGETSHPIKITVPGPFTLTALTQNEYYPDAPSLAMAYAAVVNAELRDLKAAGADFVQLDEPYLQAWPDLAREFGVAVIDRALEGIDGPTVIHLCFGYAHTVRDKPSGYSYLPELERCRATHISIEAAQPRPGLRHPSSAAVQDDHPGRARPRRRRGRDAGGRGGPDQVGAGARAARASGAGAGLRHEISAAGARHRQAGGARGRGANRPGRGRRGSTTARLSERRSSGGRSPWAGPRQRAA